MKIHHKLLATFSVIALLAGVVSLYSLNATQQIIKSFEGGEEHFQKIIHAANEVGSHSKMAQSHLMLYLTLQKKSDREEFFKRYRTMRQQVLLLDDIVKEPEAREIVKIIRADVGSLYRAAMDTLNGYDEEYIQSGYYNAANHSNQIRTFFAVSSNVMGAAAQLANLETDFLNKQFAIMNASTINHLAKLSEGQLLLYMILNDNRDLEKYLVGIRSLDSTVKTVKDRVRDEIAQEIILRIESEVGYFRDAGQALFESFHSDHQRVGNLDLKIYEDQLRDFHFRSSSIRELSVSLSNMMTEHEYRRKEFALNTAASIQRSVFFFVVVGGVLTLLLGYFLSAAVAEPIVKLKEAALQIGKGNMDAAKGISGRGEIGELAKTFQTMAQDLKVAQNDLLAAKEYTDNVLRSMSDALCVVSPYGKVTIVNIAMCNLTGFTADELIGQPFVSIFASAPPFTFDEGGLEDRANIAPLITSYNSKNGEPIYVSYSSSVMYDVDSKLQGIVCVAQDMTERRQAMKELRQLATVVEQAAEAIVVSDTAGKIQYVNPSFEHITGYAREEAIGQNINMLKSGKQDEQFYKELWSTLKRGEIWGGRFVNRRKDGSFYEEECTISPVYDESREIINYVALKRDVTRESRLERQLQQSQKHEALGTLAGGIAHDFNNILNAILAYADGSLSEVPADSKAHRNIEEIILAGSRAADLVNQILTFSRPTKQLRKSMELQSLIKGALNLLRGTIPSTIEINKEIDSECRAIFADATQIHQVIVNLCTNAYHALRDKGGGKLIVKLQEINIGPDQAAERQHLDPGDYAKISIIDTGRGMSSAVMQRIFEPYFTTKKQGEGTGLGLATAHGIIESHNGFINVISELGVGSTFEVYLPIRVERKTVVTKKEKPVVPKVTGNILFVDDEVIIVQSMKIVLKQMGCEVTTFTNSLKALETFKANPDAFDLVITDQTMPGITGSEMSKEIISIRPEIPIILTTGFTETINAEQAKEIGIREFLMKPMVIEDLKETVWKLLAEKN